MNKARLLKQLTKKFGKSFTVANKKIWDNLIVCFCKSMRIVDSTPEYMKTLNNECWKDDLNDDWKDNLRTNWYTLFMIVKKIIRILNDRWR